MPSVGLSIMQCAGPRLDPGVWGRAHSEILDIVARSHPGSQNTPLRIAVSRRLPQTPAILWLGLNQMRDAIPGAGCLRADRMAELPFRDPQ